MNIKTCLKILLSSVALSALPLSAQTTLWDDSFTGTTLDDSWLPQLGGGSSVTQDDALVMLPAAGGFGRGFLVTNNVQAGADPAVEAEFNGNPAYNFFEHDLQLTYDALSIPSDVTAGSLIFYSGVSGNPITNSAGPRNGQTGAFVRVTQSATSLQLGVLEGAIPDGPGRAVYGTKTLNALPASIVFNLNAIGWSVEITGTTFTDGSITTSGTWTNVTSAIFATDAALVVGTYEEGAVTWASGASDTPMTLGRFEATAMIATLWNDSFAGTTLNNSWTTHGASSVTQNDALVMLPSAGGFDRGFLVTNNVQYGADPAVKAQFNGNPAYNFFEHDLQLTYDALSIPSDVTAGNLIFYSGVSGNPITSSAGPRNGQPGAFVRVMQSASSLQLGVLDYLGSGGRTSYGTKTLNALPASIVFNLNATGWSVDITGTTFTDGSTTTSGTWTNVTAATFATDASLVVGTYEENAVTWASGASDTPMTLGRFEATAMIPTLWDDSFAGTTLDDSWQVHSTGDSSVTQDDALVILPDGSGGFDRAFLATNNLQTGTDATTKAQFKGNPAYNFFEHDLQLTYDDLAIPSDVTAGDLIFYSGVSGNPVTTSGSPRGGQPGAFVRVRQGVSVLKLEVLEGAIPDGPGRAVYGTKSLTVLPDSIVFDLNATGWSVEITGTTFADGSTTTSGAWINVTAATFATDAALIVGTYQEANVTWAGGASDTPVTLGRFQATAYLLAFPELEQQAAPVGDFNRDGVVDADDVAVANSYLDGSIDGGADAATRQSLRMAQGMTAAQALVDLNLAEFDVDGDGTFDAADVTLLEDVVNGVAPVTESADFNVSDDFELVVDGLLAGKTYYLMRATDLSAGFTTTEDTVTATSRTETFIDVDSPAGNAFYKVTD